MSFIDRIAACNNGDVFHYVPFVIDGTRYGWLRPAFASVLLDYTDTFQPAPDGGVTLADGLNDFDARSRAAAGTIAQLYEDGVIRRLHGEKYPVCSTRDQAPLMQLDRSSAPYFGIRAWGVHMNGFVRDGSQLKMWIARRAADKPNYPGLLDNMVAGGQPIGIGLKENLIKECAEEADIPATTAQAARAVGHVSYCQETRDGLKPDVMLAYDLELPLDFIPRPADGEVDYFELMEIDRIADLVRDTTEFKPNCALIIIDFLVRHGRLTPDNCPEFHDIIANLRR